MAIHPKVDVICFDRAVTTMLVYNATSFTFNHEYTCGSAIFMMPFQRTDLLTDWLSGPYIADWLI